MVSPTSKLSSSTSSFTYLYVAFTRYKTPGGKSVVVAPVTLNNNSIVKYLIVVVVVNDAIEV